MATLPRAVQMQVEAADALLGSMNQEAQGETPADAPLEAPQEPQPTQASADPPAKQPAPPPPEPDVWERKYKTLQGLFNAEVPKLQGQVKELSARLERASDQLEKAAQKPPAPTPPAELADKSDVDTFGQDMLEMVTRVVTRALGGVAQRVDASVSTLEKRLATVEASLNGTSQTVAYTAEQVFFDRLKELAPNWEKLNTDDAFLLWLSEADPVYGVPRQNALNAARGALDASRAAAIFNAFSPPAPPVPDKQVSPRSSAAPQPSPASKPILTQAQIASFYRDVQLGKYRGRDQEMKNSEAIINQALAEGRVR
jgi:uncharacterized protein YukE